MKGKKTAGVPGFIGARSAVNEHRWFALLEAALTQPNPSDALKAACEGLLHRPRGNNQKTSASHRGRLGGLARARLRFSDEREEEWQGEEKPRTTSRARSGVDVLGAATAPAGRHWHR